MWSFCIPGHEPAGVIAAVGAFVQNAKEGDEVIISPSGFCGVCRNCRLGMTHYCEHAYTKGGDGYEVRPGSFAEYTVTGANNVYPKPANLSFDAACQGNPAVEHGKGWFTIRRFAWGTTWWWSARVASACIASWWRKPLGQAAWLPLT
jgi:Zn-dependent alcohol dehydrogenase